MEDGGTGGDTWRAALQRDASVLGRMEMGREADPGVWGRGGMVGVTVRGHRGGWVWREVGVTVRGVQRGVGWQGDQISATKIQSS